jgi:cytochrome c
LINQSDCKSCHSLNKKTLGPPYKEIAEKYKGDTGAQNYLARKIISGGTGVWGNMAMPPHPTISEGDANTIVKFILSLGEQNLVKALPVKGNYTTVIPDGESDNGSFIFRAAYTDRGTNVAPEQSSVDIVVLRNSIIPVSQADEFKDIQLNHQIDPNRSTITPKGPGSYLRFNKIDLTGIKQIEFAASAIPDTISNSGEVIEIRIDSPKGKLIGQTRGFKLSKNKYGSIISVTKAAIDQVNGVYNVFFIFNFKSDNSIDQMQIRNIYFIQ